MKQRTETFLMAVSLFLATTLFLTPSLVYSETTAEMIDKAIKENPASAIELVLPINVANSNNINLKVEVPKNFKKLSCENCANLEFIPVGDKDPFVWSEIITVTPLVGKKLKAEELVKNFKVGIEKAAQNVKILEENYRSDDKFNEGHLLMVYSNQARRELLRVYAVGGPFDAVIVQDAILIANDTDIEKGTLQLDSFFKNNVSITDGVDNKIPTKEFKDT